jgi:hypothetical protein
MAFTPARLKRYLNTAWAIAASPYVEEYLIGFTARSENARYKEYKVWDYDYLVILADKLTRFDAKYLEQYLQRELLRDKRSTAFHRYNKRRRGLRYYPSHGGIEGDPEAKIHSVYMAWWEP